jgi:gliding motility-associated-like protein
MKKYLCFILLIFYMQWGAKAQFVDFNYNPKEGCDSAWVTFSNTSNLGIDTNNLNIQWSFGNGETYPVSNYFKINPPKAIHYSSPGNYNVTLSITRKSGTLIKEHVVSIHSSPNPFFQVYDTVSGTDTFYVFKAASGILPDTCYKWYILGVDTLIGSRFAKEIPAEGTYPTILVVTDTSKLHCKSVYQKNVYAFRKLNVPNYISPDNDGKNDFFTVQTNGTTQFRLNIFSRSGLLIFQSEGTQIFWDGYLYSGELVKPGTYFYIIETISGAIDFKEKGFLYVLY